MDAGIKLIIIKSIIINNGILKYLSDMLTETDYINK